jgi:hypothetical protein
MSVAQLGESFRPTACAFHLVSHTFQEELEQFKVSLFIVYGKNAFGSFHTVSSECGI